MATPLVSVIVPTKGRPDMLVEALESVLEQSVDDLEVIVVDDGSPQPVVLGDDPRITVIRHERSRGGAAARNTGLRSATGHWVVHVDDDDIVLPGMLERALTAIETADLPSPIAALSAVDEVDVDGNLVGRRVPPTALRRGAHYGLEPLEPGRSYLCKQTLVAELRTLRDIGGWNESYRSRVHTELFLRLSPVCSLVGVETPGYLLRAHDGPRVSRDPVLRQESFANLIADHRGAFEAHPVAFSRFLRNHAAQSLEDGDPRAATRALMGALRVAPTNDVRRSAALLRGILRQVAPRRRR